MTYDSASDVDKRMLKLGIHKGYPGPRKEAAERFVKQGHSVYDLDRLHAHAVSVGVDDPAAIVATWLKNTDGMLIKRTQELREAELDAKANPVLEENQALEEGYRRAIALRCMTGDVEHDNTPLSKALRIYNELYDVVITEEEARRHILNTAVERGYRSVLDGPPPALATIQDMCRKAQEKARQ